jgi:serine/threonine protein kinase
MALSDMSQGFRQIEREASRGLRVQDPRGARLPILVHCDLKAANVLTTKLSDFGVSFNLRAMEREIKDVAGMFIELLTRRPPYGNIGNALTGELVGIWCLFRSSLIRKITRAVMLRIVEDVCPPILDRFSGPLVAFHGECFHMDPAMRPRAEKLFEHEVAEQGLWLEQGESS